MKTDPLKQIPLFTSLSERERHRITGQLAETCYKKGEYIFREGDPAERFHILASGSVKCVKTSSDGKEVTMKVLMPGDLFCCDVAVIEGAVHPGCAQPMGEVRVLSLTKKSYFNMLRRNPDAALEVIRYLGCRLHEAQEKAKVMALNPADQRLASLLVNLASRTGVPHPNGVRLTVRLTRRDLADMVGLTPETAIRVMSRFKHQKMVTGTAKNLIILDLEKLKTLAEPSPSSR